MRSCVEHPPSQKCLDTCFLFARQYGVRLDRFLRSTNVWVKVGRDPFGAPSVHITNNTDPLHTVDPTCRIETGTTIVVSFIPYHGEVRVEAYVLGSARWHQLVGDSIEPGSRTQVTCFQDMVVYIMSKVV
jgi:hypothetical protein